MHSSIYLCTLFLFILSLWIVVTLSVTPSFPPFLCSNCRTSSNCVNNNRSRVSSVSLYLFVTSCDPPPPLKSITHSFIHSFIRALKVLFIVVFFFFLSVNHFDLTHAASSAAAAAPPLGWLSTRDAPTFREKLGTLLSTTHCDVHGCLYGLFFFLLVFYFAFLQQSGWLSSFSF